MVDRLSAHLFGGHVVDGSHHRSRQRPDRFRRQVRRVGFGRPLRALREAEVEDLDVAVAGDEDVFGLQVPVDDSLLVGGAKARRDLQHSRWRAGAGAPPSSALRVSAFEELHDGVGGARACQSKIRMFGWRAATALARSIERAVRIARRRLGQDLDGDLSSRACRARRPLLPPAPKEQRFRMDRVSCRRWCHRASRARHSSQRSDGGRRRRAVNDLMGRDGCRLRDSVFSCGFDSIGRRSQRARATGPAQSQRIRDARHRASFHPSATRRWGSPTASFSSIALLVKYSSIFARPQARGPEPAVARVVFDRLGCGEHLRSPLAASRAWEELCSSSPRPRRNRACTVGPCIRRPSRPAPSSCQAGRTSTRALVERRRR